MTQQDQQYLLFNPYANSYQKLYWDQDGKIWKLEYHESDTVFLHSWPLPTTHQIVTLFQFEKEFVFVMTEDAVRYKNRLLETDDEITRMIQQSEQLLLDLETWEDKFLVMISGGVTDTGYYSDSITSKPHIEVLSKLEYLCKDLQRVFKQHLRHLND